MRLRTTVALARIAILFGAPAAVALLFAAFHGNPRIGAILGAFVLGLPLWRLIERRLLSRAYTRITRALSAGDVPGLRDAIADLRNGLVIREPLASQLERIEQHLRSGTLSPEP
jgi:hypothetical protein